MFKEIKTAEQLAAEAKQQAFEFAKENRSKDYAREADPLFFKAQRGEVAIEEWQTKVEEIRARYPYPELEEGV